MLKTVAGVDEIDLDLKVESTLKEMYLELSCRYPSLKSQLVEPFKNTLVLINGIEKGNLSGDETKLTNGATIVLLPITHGG